MVGALRQEVTPETLIDEWILNWKTPDVAGKVLILVEGKDDKLFYNKFFKRNQAVVKDCSGCKKVLEIYRLLQQRTEIVNVAIKDSDFDRLNGKLPPGENFFFSDAHDYEMMCLKNEKARKRFFDNLNIDKGEELLQKVMADLKLLSFFKWFNYTNHLNFNFKGFKVADKCPKDIKNYSFIYSLVSSMSSKASPIQENDLSAFMDANCSIDFFDLVNGHDFLERLAYYLKVESQDFANINEIKLRLVLYPVFLLDNFRYTGLYNDIRSWEQKHSFSILREDEFDSLN